MPKEYSRISRVESLIQAEIAQLIELDFRYLDLGLVTVTNVKVSPDLSRAKIYFIVHEKEKKQEILKHLQQEAKSLRHLLCQRVKLRKSPELHFYYDDVVEHGDRISKLLNTSS
jgi:ribosome-binding factor A